MKQKLINKLLALSDKNKDGFTIQLIDGKIESFKFDKGYLVSFKNLILIDKNKHNKNVPFIYKTTFIQNVILSDNLIYNIGGWLDVDNNTYHIELNMFTFDKDFALNMAKKFNQRFIWDVKNKKCIRV